MESTTTNYGKKAANYATDKASSFAAEGKNMAEKVESKFDNVVSKVSDIDWREQVQNVRAQADKAYAGSVDTVKAHPVLSVVGAAAIGFLAGSLLTRRH